MLNIALSLALALPFFLALPLAQIHGTGWFVTPPGIAVCAILAAWVLLVFYVMLAAVVKRFHDRNKSAWWLAYFFGVPVAFFAAAFVPIGWPPREVFPGAVIAMYLFFAFAWLNNLWYLLELLALPGTKGDNRFGSNPLVNDG